MKVLLDQNMPAKLRKFLPGNLVLTARQMSWDLLPDDRLLRAAQSAGFEVMVTGDKSIEKQQNNAERVISLVVVSLTDWDLVRNHVAQINAAIQRSSKGSFETVKIFRPTPIAKPSAPA